MSKSYTLICPNNITIESVAMTLKNEFDSKLGQMAESTIMECYIENKDGAYVSISLFEELKYLYIEDYSEYEEVTANFKTNLMTSNFLIITFNDKQFAEKIIKKIITNFKQNINEIWLDNDYGKILEGNLLLNSSNFDCLKT